MLRALPENHFTAGVALPTLFGNVSAPGLSFQHSSLSANPVGFSEKPGVTYLSASVIGVASKISVGASLVDSGSGRLPACLHHPSV